MRLSTCTRDFIAPESSLPLLPPLMTPLVLFAIPRPFFPARRLPESPCLSPGLLYTRGRWAEGTPVYLRHIQGRRCGCIGCLTYYRMEMVPVFESEFERNLFALRQAKLKEIAALGSGGKPQPVYPNQYVATHTIPEIR